jgi:hypothetical protein
MHPTPRDPELLKIALEELRLTYGRLNEAYARARAKILTFLGGGLALMSYLYAGGDFFFPPQIYGRIIYCIAFVLAILGLGLLFYALGTIFWRVPTEQHYKKMLADHPTKDDFLEFLVDEYVQSLAGNIPKYEKKHMLLNLAFFCLTSGAIILLILKSFGG